MNLHRAATLALAISVFCLSSVGCRRDITIVSGSQPAGWYLMVPPLPSWLWKQLCLSDGKPINSTLCGGWESRDEERSIAEWLTLRPYDSARECLSARARLFKVADLIDDVKIRADVGEFTAKRLADADKELAQSVDSLYLDRDFDHNALGDLSESEDLETGVEQVDKDAMEIPARRWNGAKCIASDDPRLKGN